MTRTRYAVTGAVALLVVVGLLGASVASALDAGASLWSLLGVAIFAPTSATIVFLLALGLDGRP